MHVSQKKNEVSWLDQVFSYIRTRKLLKEIRKSKRQADVLAELKNKRHFVLMTPDGKYRPFTRDHIKYLKKKGRLAPGVNIFHLLDEAYYIADPDPILNRSKRIDRRVLSNNAQIILK